MRPSDITDAYLVALAVKNQGCLVTLDQKIAVSWALKADARHLRVLV
jgi:predicted nucleic acid-binding protein